MKKPVPSWNIDPFPGKRLLLHSCCAPCSSAVLEVLKEVFDVTVLAFNPNIWPQAEHDRRLDEQARLLEALDIPLLHADDPPELFEDIAAGLEDAPEGGARCTKCFALRLSHAAQTAKEQGFDCFTTTLSVSPHKNAALLNQIGEQMAAAYGIPYVYADFKKNNGYLRSLELSKEYGLYRQSYCGCRFSVRVSCP